MGYIPLAADIKEIQQGSPTGYRIKIKLLAQAVVASLLETPVDCNLLTISTVLVNQEKKRSHL